MTDNLLMGIPVLLPCIEEQKKDGVNINYFIRRDVKEKLDAYCEDVGQTATMAIERILDDYLTKFWLIRKTPLRAKMKADMAMIKTHGDEPWVCL